MEKESCGLLEREGLTALAYMEQALELLDRCEGTLDVGAHLDLAICRLRDVLGHSSIDPGERQRLTY